MIDLNVELNEEDEAIDLGYDSDDCNDDFHINLDLDENPLNDEGDDDDDFANGDAEKVGDELVNEVLQDFEPNDTEKIVSAYVGMVFESVEEILNHCHEYARQSGFQIKIRSYERTKGKENPKNENGIERNRNIVDYSDCVRLRLVCSKGGQFNSKTNNPRQPATTTITGCEFKVNASRCQDDGSWKLTKVLLEHNHPWAPKTSKLMWNYKHISEEDRRRILENDTTGFPIAKNFNSFLVKYGGHDKVPFDERDCCNLISKVRRLSLHEGDFVAMMRHFCEMIENNSDFFYMYNTDKKGKLRNAFWADGMSRAACKEFGDVITFDTTYVSNRYRMPFAPFIGVNNHGQFIMLGYAMLAGEEASDFVWLFKAWLTYMYRKASKGVLTDQCQQLVSDFRLISN